MKTIKILKNVVIGNKVAQKDTEQAVDNKVAERLIKRGVATAVVPPKPAAPDDKDTK